MRAGLTLALAAATLAVAAPACGGGDAEVGASDSRIATPEPRLGLQRLAHFRDPVHITQPPGVRDLLFVAEKAGLIRVLKNDRKLKRPFLDLRKYVRAGGTEQGLVSLAFPPGYRRGGRFYVAYTDESGGDLRIEEYRVRRKDPTRARRGSRRKVLEIEQPTAIHNGGLLLFGPDGRLDIGAGDGGPSYDPGDVGQRRKSLLGKLLRIEPRRLGRSPSARTIGGRIYTVSLDGPVYRLVERR